MYASLNLHHSQFINFFFLFIYCNFRFDMEEKGASSSSFWLRRLIVVLVGGGGVEKKK